MKQSIVHASDYLLHKGKIWVFIGPKNKTFLACKLTCYELQNYSYNTFSFSKLKVLEKLMFAHFKIDVLEWMHLQFYILCVCSLKYII